MSPLALVFVIVAAVFRIRFIAHAVCWLLCVMDDSAREARARDQMRRETTAPADSIELRIRRRLETYELSATRSSTPSTIPRAIWMTRTMWRSIERYWSNRLRASTRQQDFVKGLGWP